MPCTGERAGPLKSVLYTMGTDLVVSPAAKIGLATDAKREGMSVRVSRRCTECAPTYPTSRTQSFPRSRCTVRFHCCVLGETKCRGTANTKRFVDRSEEHTSELQSRVDLVC